jgi:hypothetical protein
VIRRFFDNILAREASHYLTKRRIREERKLVHEVAQSMRVANGLPRSKALET